MIRYLWIGAGVLALLTGVFFSGWNVGVARHRAELAEVQTNQLVRDSREAVKIENRDDGRKDETRKAVEEVRKAEPEWSGRSLPAPALERLRDAGLYKGRAAP